MSSAKIGHIEQPVRHTRRHRWRDAKRPMDLDEVVCELVDGNGRHVVLDLPTKTVR
jgi:hypothetical protein